MQPQADTEMINELTGMEIAESAYKGDFMTKVQEIETKLKDMAGSRVYPAALPILTLLSTRERSRKRLSTHQVVRLLKQRGVTTSTAEVSETFTRFADLGLGTLSVGRGKFPKHISWSFNQISVGKTALLPDAHLVPQVPERTAAIEAEREYMHVPVPKRTIAVGRIIVRRGGVEIELPIDASKQAVHNAVEAMK